MSSLGALQNTSPPPRALYKVSQAKMTRIKLARWGGYIRAAQDPQIGYKTVNTLKRFQKPNAGESVESIRSHDWDEEIALDGHIRLMMASIAMDVYLMSQAVWVEFVCRSGTEKQRADEWNARISRTHPEWKRKSSRCYRDALNKGIAYLSAKI